MLPWSSSLVVASRSPPERWISGSGGTGFSGGSRGSAAVARWLQSTDSVVAAHRFSCFVACGIFPEWGSRLHLLHWQADSSPLVHQGSPDLAFLII